MPSRPDAAPRIGETGCESEIISTSDSTAILEKNDTLCTVTVSGWLLAVAHNRKPCTIKLDSTRPIDVNFQSGVNNSFDGRFTTYTNNSSFEAKEFDDHDVKWITSGLLGIDGSGRTVDLLVNPGCGTIDAVLEASFEPYLPQTCIGNGTLRRYSPLEGSVVNGTITITRATASS